ncbi:prolipoprotein diacylglyceryl transferase family protein, partial [Salinicola salarius]
MNPLDRSIALGPLGVSLGQLLLALAMIVALIVGAWVGRRRQVSVGDLLFNALLIGVIGARVVFVARYWQ